MQVFRNLFSKFNREFVELRIVAKNAKLKIGKVVIIEYFVNRKQNF